MAEISPTQLLVNAKYRRIAHFFPIFTPLPPLVHVGGTSLRIQHREMQVRVVQNSYRNRIFRYVEGTYINIAGRWDASQPASVGILRSRLNHVRMNKSIRFLLYETSYRGLFQWEGGREEKEEKKKAINFCNVIKINRDVALTSVRERDATRKFLSRRIQGCFTPRGRRNEQCILAWRLSPRDNNRKSLSLSGADSSYGATEIPDITDQVVNCFVIYRSFKGNVSRFFVYNITFSWK